MRKLCILLIMLILCSQFSSSQEITSIFERTVDKSDLQINRIAIIPNRLPLVLQESEYWIENNWKTIESILIEHGFEVVPFKSTQEVAKNVGLPLEDTFSSEDKFFNFCNETGADLVIMPYYGTAFRSKTPFIMLNKFEYISTVSFQFYSPEVNQFFHRADASAIDGYTTGWLTIGGMIALITGPLLISVEPTIPTYTSAVGGGLMICDSIWTIIQSSKPATTWHGTAFKEAIRKALQPFLAFTGTTENITTVEEQREREVEKKIPEVDMNEREEQEIEKKEESIEQPTGESSADKESEIAQEKVVESVDKADDKERKAYFHFSVNVGSAMGPDDFSGVLIGVDLGPLFNLKKGLLGFDAFGKFSIDVGWQAGLLFKYLFGTKDVAFGPGFGIGYGQQVVGVSLWDTFYAESDVFINIQACLIIKRFNIDVTFGIMPSGISKHLTFGLGFNI